MDCLQCGRAACSQLLSRERHPHLAAGHIQQRAGQHGQVRAATGQQVLHTRAQPAQLQGGGHGGSGGCLETAIVQGLQGVLPQASMVSQHQLPRQPASKLSSPQLERRLGITVAA